MLKGAPLFLVGSRSHAHGVQIAVTPGEALPAFNQWQRVPGSAGTAQQQRGRARGQGPGVSRKNFAGRKSVRGTEAAAVLYAMLESAKLARNAPRGYLPAAGQAALTSGASLLPQVDCEQLRSQRAANAKCDGQPTA